MNDIERIFDYRIADFKFWSLYLHKNQGYLGRCIIFCKRKDALDLVNATKEEMIEFFEIVHKLHNACKILFKVDWFNYAFLGNVVQHLHCHFIPRYSSSREYLGLKFTDEMWGQNYKTDNTLNFSPDLLRTIASDIKTIIKK